MADFASFSAQGPVVPINLFAQNAAAGTDIGNAVPTGVTAAIQGGFKGIETGQRITANNEQSALRQEQLRQEQLQTEIMQLQSDVTKNNRDTILETKKAELTTQRDEALQRNRDITTRNSITADASSQDPNVQRGILYNPAYQETLMRDPKLAESVYGKISQSLTPQEQKAALASLDFVKSRQLELEEQKIRSLNQRAVLAQADKTNNAFQATFADVLSAVGDTSPKVFSRIEAYPKGMKSLDANGKINSDIPDVTEQDAADAGKFMLYKDGKPYREITDSDYKLFNQQKNTQSVMDNIARESVYGPASTNNPPPASTQTQQQSAGNNNLALLGQSSIAAPQPAPTPGNQQIVEQARSQFDALAKSPPKGIQPGTLEERVRTRKDAIRQGVNQNKLERAGQQGLQNLAVDLSTMDNGATRQDFLAPQSFTPMATPSESLSSFMGEPVRLALPSQHKLDKQVAQNVTSNPLFSSSPALIKGLAAHESAGKTDAVSPTGVRGVLQVTKAVAAQYGLNRDIPEQNLLAGQLYLYDNLLRFNGNIQLALAAYSAAGPGNISEAIKATQSTEWPVIKQYLKGHLSDNVYAQVAEYPDKVISNAAGFLGSGSPDDESFVNMLSRNNLIQRQG